MSVTLDVLNDVIPGAG